MGSNILSLTSADTASRLLGFLAVAYLARTVGPEGMGLLAAGMGILTVLPRPGPLPVSAAAPVPG